MDVTKCYACHAGGCGQVPRVPRKTKVDVAKCHACHGKLGGVTGDQAQSHNCHACHAKQPWMSPRATPPMQVEGGCRQVPCLSCKVPRRHRRLRPAQARHQSQPSAISATLAKQNEGGCDQVPRLPRKTKVNVTKRHACHAKFTTAFHLQREREREEGKEKGERRKRKGKEKGKREREKGKGKGGRE